MDSVKEVFKGGWHPEKKNGNGSVWRKEFGGINQVAGWMGKGYKEDDGLGPASGRNPAPISSLPDPASFGPPPRHIALQGGGTVAPRPTSSRTSTSTTTASKTPTRPSLPAQASSQATSTAGPSTTTELGPSKPPSLPPRLPPRQNSASNHHSALPPPYTPTSASAVTPSPPAGPGSVRPDPYLNPTAAGNLGRAGINIPELGIGRASSGAGPGSGAGAPPPPLPSRASGSSTPSSSQTSLPPSSLRQRLPGLSSAVSSPSLRAWGNQGRQAEADGGGNGAPSTPLTALASGLGKLGVSVGHGLSDSSPSSAKPPPPVADPSAFPTGPLGGKKKPPPPPPPKKKTFSQGQFSSGAEVGAGSGDVPPPIPLSSKPKTR